MPALSSCRFQIIGSTKALEIAEKLGVKMTLPTLHSFCRTHNCSFQMKGKGSQFRIDETRFRKAIFESIQEGLKKGSK